MGSAGLDEEDSITESNYITILLFTASTLAILFLYLSLYRTGVVQTIQEVSYGLIHSTLLLNSVLILGAVYGVLIIYGRMTAEDLGLSVEKLPQAVAAGLILWVSVQLLQGLAGYAINGSIAIDPSWGTDSAARIGLLVGMLFGTALFEEIGFRGYLLVQFMKKLDGITNNRALSISLALLTSQALFTLMHVPWKVMCQGWTAGVLLELMFSVFMNGVIYGLFYLRTRNLFFVMIVHALGNAPTSLIAPSIEPSNILIALAIMNCAVWPKINSILRIGHLSGEIETRI